MSSPNSAVTPSRPAAPDKRPEKATGGAAGVEIVGFPQILYTRTFGAPDSLFVPLLDAAREAHAMSEGLSSHGEDKANAVMLSGMHLASSLLRDPSFSLVAKGLPHDNVYIVDLDAGTLHINTRLYAVVSRRTSFFKVEIAGNISGGPFVARNPVSGEVIMQVEEQQLRQPNFFHASLAQDCLRTQIEQERFGRADSPLVPDANAEFRLAVPVSGNKVSIALRQKEPGGYWEIIDGRRQESVGTLSSDMEEHLKAVTNFIQDCSPTSRTLLCERVLKPDQNRSTMAREQHPFQERPPATRRPHGLARFVGNRLAAVRDPIRQDADPRRVPDLPPIGVY